MDGKSYVKNCPPVDDRKGVCEITVRARRTTGSITRSVRGCSERGADSQLYGRVHRCPCSVPDSCTSGYTSDSAYTCAQNADSKHYLPCARIVPAFISCSFSSSGLIPNRPSIILTGGGQLSSSSSILTPLCFTTAPKYPLTGPCGTT